ncbi:hypothetical protein [Rariglobus hedericola]|uniref:Prenyltransferase n=1 Tax=Rariglobus hedericola TaxID=2597822 RepID=A0A556QKF8_9BACT|nr:hypothetical protein [Rariglobus hedericola]TSJ77111.1 hypothetical protein FPL22_13490 [Rariglobus hedericola]
MPQSRTSRRPPWWQWPSTLSLDAPFVAVLWQALFARKLDVHLDWHDPVLIGLAVWIIYAADRWIEGWRLDPNTVQTRRHEFYIRNRWPVFWVGIAAIIATTVIALGRLDEREFKAGFILLIPTVLYLFSHQLVHRHHPLRLPKEIVIAVIFAIGCALAPAVLAPEKITSLIIPVTLFGLLCFSNCALIASWEKEVDTLHGQTSLALQLKGRWTLIHALPWLLLIAGLLSAVLNSDPTHPGALCTAASGLLLGLLDLAQPRIGRETARALVDFTLITPVVLFFIP